MCNYCIFNKNTRDYCLTMFYVAKINWFHFEDIWILESKISSNQMSENNGQTEAWLYYFLMSDVYYQTAFQNGGIVDILLAEWYKMSKLPFNFANCESPPPQINRLPLYICCYGYISKIIISVRSYFFS